MTTGFRLTLLCLVLLCLLLSLTQPAEFNHLLPIVGSGSWFARHVNSQILREYSMLRANWVRTVAHYLRMESTGWL
jgi:hypothetical protein